MSALDKLNAKANIKIATPVKDKKKTEVKSKIKKETENKTVKPKIKSDDVVEREAEKNNFSKKHPGGRKNTRGKIDKDYKMVNIAMPMDVYEKIKEASNGNMTYYINSVLKESVKM